ncbi:MAG: PIN domain-containing protein [Methylomonas sp.]|jgi:hypothetical protein
MLVVVDTNIFISYLLVPNSQPAKTVALWQSGKFDVFTAQPRIDKLKRSFRTPNGCAISFWALAIATFAAPFFREIASRRSIF